jgi:CBS domain-containing protein
LKVESVLKSKGRRVETVRPDETVEVAVRRLDSLGIGALVVSADGERVTGIFSDRDVVSGLKRHGGTLLEMRVKDVQAHRTPSCAPTDSLGSVMEQMTRTRHRHLPVLDDGKLCGIISIGDVVKNRLEEMELETNVLRDSYIANR